MPIDYHRLKARDFGVIRQTYTERDTLLALLRAAGVGLGKPDFLRHLGAPVQL